MKLQPFLRPAAALAAALSCASPAVAGDPNNGMLHVYVHYDFMVERDGTSHAPPEAAIERVVQAFARQGIKLHIDPHHVAIPAVPMIRFPGLFTGYCPEAEHAVDFTAIKAQYFRPSSNSPWRYALFAVSQDCVGHSGVAEINGDDILISLGQYQELFEATPEELVLRIFAGTFMHELGHTLGLLHGGVDDINWKPNYLSVMNYNFGFTGIPFAATLGSVEIAGYRLDYSTRALPTLDQRDLDENVGIQAGTTDITTYNFESGGIVDFTVGPGSGPIDWNMNGTASDRHVVANLTATQDAYGGPFLGLLRGFDDWSYAKDVLRGAIPRGPKSLPDHRDRPTLRSGRP